MINTNNPSHIAQVALALSLGVAGIGSGFATQIDVLAPLTLASTANNTSSFTGTSTLILDHASIDLNGSMNGFTGTIEVKKAAILDAATAGANPGTLTKLILNGGVLTYNKQTVGGADLDPTAVQVSANASLPIADVIQKPVTIDTDKVLTLTSTYTGAITFSSATSQVNLPTASNVPTIGSPGTTYGILNISEARTMTDFETAVSGKVKTLKISATTIISG
jgi:hypothetical protein